MKVRLRAVSITLDPLRLLDEIRGAQHQRLTAGSDAHACPQLLEWFLVRLVGLRTTVLEIERRLNRAEHTRELMGVLRSL